MSLPTFIKVGRISKPIELTYGINGTAIAKTSIVFSEKYKDNEKTCFIDLVAFGKTAEALSNYVDKGHRIEGLFKLSQDTWTTQEGSNRSKHSLTLEKISEFIESKQQSQIDYSKKQDQEPLVEHQKQSIPEIDIDEDEIPF
jgi:single-strand DNA-binding protein